MAEGKPIVIIPDLKVSRPTTRGDAIRLIEETFQAKGNKWGAGEQQWFINTLGLSGDWRNFENEDLKKILDEFAKLKMILFRD